LGFLLFIAALSLRGLSSHQVISRLAALVRPIDALVKKLLQGVSAALRNARDPDLIFMHLYLAPRSTANLIPHLPQLEVKCVLPARVLLATERRYYGKSIAALRDGVASGAPVDHALRHP